jgi:hypothetical protein
MHFVSEALTLFLFLLYLIFVLFHLTCEVFIYIKLEHSLAAEEGKTRSAMIS